MDKWMDGWVEGRREVKVNTVLRIAYSNQKQAFVLPSSRVHEHKYDVTKMREQAQFIDALFEGLSKKGIKCGRGGRDGV